MRDHLKILGWIFVVSGGIALLLGVGFGAAFGFAGLATGDSQGAAVFGIIGAAFAAFMTVIALPSLLCGWGLLTWKPWARILGIILSVLHLPGFPVHTAIGVYGLWVLANDESRLLLETGGAGVPAYRRGV